MIRFQRLVFVATTALAILIVLGNLTTPAQANTANIGTPTPAGTPSIDPNHQGDPVSVEQQEELKSIVQAYFEMRYQALSVSSSDGFKQNAFGSLMSDLPEANAFLREELAKLAVEIRHAELNHLRYVDYKYFLDFRDILIDTNTEKASISVVEDNEVIYEISMELNPADPVTSRRFDIQHTIILSLDGGQWKLVSDSYDDYLWMMLRQQHKSTDELVQTTDEMLNTLKASPGPAINDNHSEPAVISSLIADPSIHSYDRQMAADYAFNHANASNYNLDYPAYPGTDCQNFVSQAIYEGGKASMFIPTPLPSPSPDGQEGWYLLNDQQRGRYWNEVEAFYDFVTQSYQYWTEGPEGYVLDVPAGYTVPPNLMVGDVIQFQWIEPYDDIWDHSVIVVDIVNGLPYVASHTTNYQREPFSTFNYKAVRFIHIERSDGYPQVRIEIVSAADDAGGNPSGNPCPKTNYDSGLNYFGGCNPSGQEGVTSGFLFRNVQIPKGAQIKYAYVNFTTDGTYTVRTEDPGIYSPISLLISGENTATPANFSSTNTPADRPNLTTSVSWPIDRTEPENYVTYDTWHWKGQRTTPSITPIIQTITGLPNWAPGNTISLIFENGGVPESTHSRRVIAYEASTAVGERYSPARLIVAYDMTSSSPSIPSGAAQDGHVLESSENSDRGGTYNSASWLFYVGDNAENKQFRGVLHFDTSGIPDTAVITSAVLKIKQYTIIGTDPFMTHGDLVADIKKPSFGNKASLERPDFEDPDGLEAAAIFEPVASDSWYSAILNSDAHSFINLIGTTQFRLAFTLDDNNDLDSDFIGIYSGDDATPENHPQLIVTYYIP